MDLRSYLEFISREHPDNLLTIEANIESSLEIAAIVWLLGKQGKYPILFFKNINNLLGSKSRIPLVTNLFASRDRCAWALNTSNRLLALEYYKRETRGVEPVVVDENDAPVKEVVLTGEEADLRMLPIIKHYEKDAGPYITGGVHVVWDPEYGYNAATIRDMYKGPRKLVSLFIKGRHTDIYHRRYEDRNLGMPIAIVIGHHPAFYLGTQTVQPITVDEYHVIGGVLGEPLRLTPSTTWGKSFLIPADAEIVIEGEVLPNVRETEGPFGEFPKTYGPVNRDGRVIVVRAINMRKNSIYLDVIPGHRDCFFLGSIPVESRIFHTVKNVVPGVRNVYLPPSGCGRFHCYIQIEKMREGDGKNAILAALSAYEVVKHVVVVDSDVDIFDEDEVLWAIATRSQLDRDLIVVEGARGSPLDPSSLNGFTARGGIDATKPLPPRLKGVFPEVISIPENIIEKAREIVGDY